MIDEILKFAPLLHSLNMIFLVISLIKILTMINRLDNTIVEFMKAYVRDKK
jgi:hypothetical protein